MNGPDNNFSDSDYDIWEDFSASSSEEDVEVIKSVLVNKDAIPRKETASKKRRLIWKKKELDKPDSTWLHDHIIADAHTAID